MSDVKVEQIDRDVAASVAVLVEMRELIRAGKADHHAEPFARHRLAARAALVAEIVAWLRKQSRETLTSQWHCAFVASADEIAAKWSKQ